MRIQTKFRSALVVAGFSLAVGNAAADIATDHYVQNDYIALPAAGEGELFKFQQQQVEWLLEEGYSPASVILSSVTRGLTIADTVYLMTRVQPENAQLFYDTAVVLLPSLPGWVCGTDAAMNHRYDDEIMPDQLSEQPSLEEVSRLYFDEYQRFMAVPDWQNGQGHLDVSIDELIDFKQREIELVSEDADSEEERVDSWWYLQQGSAAPKVLSVGLFPKQRRVVIDARLEDLEKLKQQGTTRLPVMIAYNQNQHIPTSDVERVAGEPYGGSTMKSEEIDYIDKGDREITASEVIRHYEVSGEELPPTREWRIGDYHLEARIEELLELFDIPEKKDIPESDWNRAVAAAQQSPKEPLHITLYGDAAGERWIDSRAAVRLAEEQGVDRLPVVFFYHDIGRQPCGIPAGCTDQIKEAAGLIPVIIPTKRPPKIPPPILGKGGGDVTPPGGLGPPPAVSPN